MNYHNELYYKQECYDIQGAIFEVYREMGAGFLEAVYQECLEKELRLRQIPFVSQQELKLTYKGEILQQTYPPDLICFGEIIVELKALSETCGNHESQVLNYLKATDKKLGFLINFGSNPKATVSTVE